MSTFSFFHPTDIDLGVQQYLSSSGAILLDVRTRDEYRGGHIPHSKNIPLQTIDKAVSVVENKDTPLFVYCHSGVRSRQAVESLEDLGYTNVTNIGGIAAYSGKVER